MTPTSRTTDVTVLILARDFNPSVDRVVEVLGERDVPVFRTDLAAFPRELTFEARLGPNGWDGVLANGHRELRLSDVRSVWYRNPTRFVLPDGMSATERQHAEAEARAGLGGVLSSLDVLWCNHPARQNDTTKPRQLDVARRSGLSVPDSLVTNRPEAVRLFARTVNGPLASKTLAASLRMESGRLQMAYTRRLGPLDLIDLAGVDVTAHLFQEFLPKAMETRVTVVGDRVFAVAIHADSDAAKVDWRSDYESLRYTVVEPPDAVRVGMLTFLQFFGLAFGAFDFVITPDEEWIMLECNPAGAFGWLEDALALPITSALADLLARGTAA